MIIDRLALLETKEFVSCSLHFNGQERERLFVSLLVRERERKKRLNYGIGSVERMRKIRVKYLFVEHVERVKLYHVFLRYCVFDFVKDLGIIHKMTYCHVPTFRDMDEGRSTLYTLLLYMWVLYICPK